MKKIYLVRHGETEWTLSGQHTSLSDISLTENGKAQAQLLAKRLKEHAFHAVFTSPLQRAKKTCAIAGFADRAVVDPRLVEWNYGTYEGLTSKEIHVQSPHWNIFQNGAPGGESVSDIEERTADLLKSLHAIHGDILIFSHGHLLRSLGVRYIGFPVAAGKHFTLFPASISILAHEKTAPAISLWNDISHLL